MRPCAHVRKNSSGTSPNLRYSRRCQLLHIPHLGNITNRRLADAFQEGEPFGGNLEELAVVTGIVDVAS